jgi:predicted transcriptional regulator of viral defense system
MKNNFVSKSLLTQAQAHIIDEAGLRHGDIITFDQILGVFGQEYSRAYLKRIMSQLVRNGWLVRLRKGEYFITDLSNLGRTSLSIYFIANYYVKDSYVSLAQALQYHGMYDQFLSAVVSVSLRQHKPVLLEGVTYRYIKTQEKYFYGYEEVRIDGRIVRIAAAEKALIDMIQFHRTAGAVDMVTEKVIDYQDELDFDRLVTYLARSNRTVRRVFADICLHAGHPEKAAIILAMDEKRSSADDIVPSTRRGYISVAS